MRPVARFEGVIAAMADRGVHWNQALRARYRPVFDRARAELGVLEADRLAAEGAG